MGDVQQRQQGVLVLGRSRLGAGRLAAESLDDVCLLLELLGGPGESAGPLRARRRAGVPDLSDGPQRRGERRGIDHQHPAVVEHDRRAGADPGTALVVGVPVLGEGVMQVLVDVLEVVQAEVDGVLPPPSRSAHRCRRAQGPPRQGLTWPPLDDLAAFRTCRLFDWLRHLLRAEQLEHPPVLQGPKAVIRGRVHSHTRILPRDPGPRGRFAWFGCTGPHDDRPGAERCTARRRPPMPPATLCSPSVPGSSHAVDRSRC